MIAGYVTMAEAAARFGVTRHRLQKAACQGRLPAIKLPGGRALPWLVKPAAVARFLATTKPGRPRKAKAAAGTAA